MSGRISRAALVVALGAAVPAGAAARPIDDAALERARQAVLDDSYQPALPRYETDLGSDAAAPALPPRRAGEARDDVERAPARVDARSHDDARGSSVMTVVMWALVVVVAVLIVAWLVSELSRHGGDAELAADLDAGDPLQAARAAIIERPLGDADELAGRGEFAEAIHTLLLRTLHELARSAALRVAPAMTSREILAGVPLVGDARSALAGLISAVEVTHFGAAPASAADYARCRQQFTAFAAAFGAGAAARSGAAA